MAVDPRKCVLVCVLLSSVFLTCLSSEQGKWSKTLRVNSTVSYVAVYKTLYNNSGIHLSITCGEESEGIVEVNWMLRWSPCAEEYLEVTSKQEYNLVTRPTEDFYFIKPDMSRVVGMVYPEVEYVKAIPQIINCTDKAPQYLTLTKEFTTSKMSSVDENGKIITTPKPEKGKEKVVAETLTEGEAKNKTKPKTNTASRKRRAEAAEGDNQKKAPALQHHPDKPTHHDLLSEAWRDGVYLFILQVKTPGGQTDEQVITADISMEYKDAYLSAMEWPLLIFFGVMCVVYVILGLVWLVMLACNWRDLLRVQFWIGGVIVLGMLEKAVFYAEYQNINSKGESVPGAVICAELVSCLKRTVARMLVIIVSLGFGIVKPRLGPMLHKVLGVGTLYFIFAAVEGCYRTVKAKSDQSRKLILVAVPLALIDAIICWWIFSSLVQTLRTLRLRRNIVKLSLYRHFTNTLVFAVLASIAFMVWSYTQHRLKMCLTDWKELWVDDAYWHLLFSVILVVIMVLWRPTINNQRYAFSPLLDAADDEADEDVIMSDAWDGMKMRGVRNGSPRQSAASKAEDDLKWVEENIPSSIIDKALPVIDSDEEIVTTKLEMAKME